MRELGKTAKALENVPKDAAMTRKPTASGDTLWSYGTEIDKRYRKTSHDDVVELNETQMRAR